MKEQISKVLKMVEGGKIDVDDDVKKYVRYINFKEIRQSIDILLKEYKGINIVDIESKDGSKVNIIV